MPRRDFLRKAGVLTGGTLAAPLVLNARGQRTPANERVTLAVIGCGNQAPEDLKHFLPIEQLQVVAVCDVNRASYGYKTPKQYLGREPVRDLVNKYYAQSARSGTYRGCDAYEDFREVLARKDVDAVAIITPDHWHAIMTIWAAAPGRTSTAKSRSRSPCKTAKRRFARFVNISGFYKLAANGGRTRPSGALQRLFATG